MRNILLRLVLWFFSVLILFFAARVLRGKQSYTGTLRVAGFAQSAHILQFLALIPAIGGSARFIAMLVTVVAVWMGVATAHELKGWRTLILPVLYILVMVISLAFLAAAIAGAAYTWNAVLQGLGFAGQ